MHLLYKCEVSKTGISGTGASEEGQLLAVPGQVKAPAVEGQ